MPILTHSALRSFGYAIFTTAGVPPDQARLVTDHLVESNLVGHDSHGIMRIPGYVRGLLKGETRPVEVFPIVRETPASLVIDANRGLGIVMAHRAMTLATERAQQHTFGAVAVHRSGHIGRLGAFPPLAAQQGCIGVLLLNGGAQFTAPFGGTGRRLPPNPIAISVPTLAGPPMTLDITTSMVAGGKVDVHVARRQNVPAGWLIDESGQAVLDPVAFREGRAAMLPLGGPLGYKGYGLAMMVDAIAGGLSWAGCSSQNPTRGSSGFFALAIRIESFIDLEEFKQEVQKLIDWVKSSPTLPGVERIYAPGEMEEENRRRREAEGIMVEESTWQALLATAAELKVPAPAPE